MTRIALVLLLAMALGACAPVLPMACVTVPDPSPTCVQAEAAYDEHAAKARAKAMSDEEVRTWWRAVSIFVDAAAQILVTTP